MRFIAVDHEGNWLEVNGEMSIQKVEDAQFNELQSAGRDALDEDEELPGTTCATISVIYVDSHSDSLELMVVGDVSYLGRLTPKGPVPLKETSK